MKLADMVALVAAPTFGAYLLLVSPTVGAQNPGHPSTPSAAGFGKHKVMVKTAPAGFGGVDKATLEIDPKTVHEPGAVVVVRLATISGDTITPIRDLIFDTSVDGTDLDLGTLSADQAPSGSKVEIQVLVSAKGGNQENMSRRKVTIP